MPEEPQQTAQMRTSVRDLDELRERLRSWLTGRLGCPVTVSRLSHPCATACPARH
ncbi:hypothetical protein ACFQX6_24485 [Streptosporangium lutulentum]